MGSIPEVDRDMPLGDLAFLLIAEPGSRRRQPPGQVRRGTAMSVAVGRDGLLRDPRQPLGQRGFRRLVQTVRDVDAQVIHVWDYIGQPRRSGDPTVTLCSTR